MSQETDLSELQLDIMRVLWNRREATAAEVQVALEGRELAITTVSTLLTRLEKRGIVSHRSEGRLFIYRAELSEPDARRSMLGSLVDTLFGGDPTAVVSQLLASRDISPGDVERMRQLIDESRPRGGRRRG